MEGSVARLADDGQKKKEKKGEKKESARQWPPVDDKRGRRGEPSVCDRLFHPSQIISMQGSKSSTNLSTRYWPRADAIDLRFRDFARVNANVSQFLLLRIRLLPILLSYIVFWNEKKSGKHLSRAVYWVSLLDAEIM